MYNTLQEIHSLMRLLGLEESTGLIKRVRAAIKRGDERQLQRLLQKLRALSSKKLAVGDHFPVPTAESLGVGVDGIKIGQDYNSSEWFIWPRSSWFHGAMITGDQGSGKTNLALWMILQLHEKGLRTWCFDRRFDFCSPIRRAIGSAVIIPETRLRLNPLRPPAGVETEVWDQAFVQSAMHAWGLKLGSEAFMQKVLAELRSKFSSSHQPTLFDLLKELESQKKLSRDEWGYCNRLKSRLSALLKIGGRIFHCRQGFFEPLLASNRTVVFVHQGSRFLTEFIDLILMWKVYYSHLYAPEKVKPLLFTLDEARNLLRERGRTTQEEGVMDVDELSSRLRPLQCGLLVVDQMASQISKTLRSNAEFKCTMAHQPEEARVIAETMGLTQPMYYRVLQLRPGEAIVRLASARTPYPMLLKVPLFPFSTEREPIAELYKACEPALKELEAQVKGADGNSSWSAHANSNADPAGPVISKEVLLVLKHIASLPFLSQQERAAALGRSTKWLTTRMEELTKNGLAEIIRCNQGKPKGLTLLYRCTDQGVKLLSSLGISVHTHGDLCHRFLLHQIECHFTKDLGWKCRFQTKLKFNSKIPDLLIDVPGQGQVPLELETCGADYALVHITNLVPLFPAIVMVANSKALLEAIQTEARRILASGQFERILWLLFEQTLEITASDFLSLLRSLAGSTPKLPLEGGKHPS